MGYRDSYVFIARKGYADNVKEKLVKHNEGFAQIEISAAGQPLAWYWFDPGRAYDPMIGRWMSVDPKLFPSWSPYNYVLNNPLRIFDPDGQSGVDVSNAAYNIHNKGYFYFWGGKHPNDNLITHFNREQITRISRFLSGINSSLAQVGVTDKDLGYDCSGFVAAINEKNPDHSYSFEGKNVEGIYDLMNSHFWAYDKITDANKLAEGDFLINKSKTHIVAIVRDPKTGKLVIAEAPESGKKVGLKDSDKYNEIINNVKKGEYVGFHDRGNDYKFGQTKAKRDKTRTDSFSGWGAENGGSELFGD